MVDKKTDKARAVPESYHVVNDNDGKVWFYIKRPTVADTQEADWEYSRMFNKAIREGISPRDVLLRALEAQGIWTQEEIDKERQLEQTLAETEEKLKDLSENSTDEAAFADAKVRVREARDELLAFREKINPYLAHTAENRADDSRLFYLTYACSVDADGKRIWKSFEDFKREKDEVKINMAFMHFLLMSAELAGRVLESLPENSLQLKQLVRKETESKALADDTDTDTTAESA